MPNQTKYRAGDLLGLAAGYWQPFVLHAAVKLDLFTFLGDQSLSAAQIADGMGADKRGVTILLNALSAMSLIRQSPQSVYTSTPDANLYLNRRSKAYIGYMILHHHHIADGWAQLDAAVKTGKPVGSRAGHDEGQRREAFLMGMYNLASQQAPEIVATVDLHHRKRLLDLGGGPGTYAIHFCQHYPRLEAVVFDLPSTRPFAEKTIAHHDLANRITFRSGNFVQDSIEGPFDVIWISHILHAEGPEACDHIITKAVRALAPGGMMLIHDFILDDTLDGPLFPALFALNMLQATPDGRSYSEGQIREMLMRAGIKDVERLNYRGPTDSGILVGTMASV